MAAAAGRKVRTQIAKELLRCDGVDINATDKAGRTAWGYAIKKSNGWAFAALLVEAGAAVHLTDRDAELIQDTWLPVLRFAQDRVTDLLGGKVSVEDLAACETAECLAGVVIPDVEVQRAPEVKEEPKDGHGEIYVPEEGAIRMLPYRPAWLGETEETPQTQPEHSWSLNVEGPHVGTRDGEEER